MSSSRPVIAVTCTQFEYAGEPACRLARNYTDSVIEAGGLPVIVPLTRETDVLDAIVAQADGLLLTGGNDLAATLYRDALDRLGEADDAAEKLIVDPTPLRDEVELHLLAQAEARLMPVLGICRGMQIMNAAHGGTLFCDIPAQHAPEPGTLAITHNEYMDGRIAHEVDVAPGSLLERALGPGRVGVNSLHHQTVRTLAERFSCVARATDGVVEALEDPTYPFMLGVQWHPEYFCSKPPMRGIFDAIVDAARAHCGRRA